MDLSQALIFVALAGTALGALIVWAFRWHGRLIGARWAEFARSRGLEHHAFQPGGWHMNATVTGTLAGGDFLLEVVFAPKDAPAYETAPRPRKHTPMHTRMRVALEAETRYRLLINRENFDTVLAKALEAREWKSRDGRFDRRFFVQTNDAALTDRLLGPSLRAALCGLGRPALAITSQAVILRLRGVIGDRQRLSHMAQIADHLARRVAAAPASAGADDFPVFERNRRIFDRIKTVEAGIIAIICLGLVIFYVWQRWIK